MEISRWGENFQPFDAGDTIESFGKGQELPYIEADYFDKPGVDTPSTPSDHATELTPQFQSEGMVEYDNTFPPESERLPYDPSEKGLQTFEQMKEDSCVSACTRMIIHDQTGVERPEAYIRQYIESQEPIMGNVPDTLKEYKVNQTYEFADRFNQGGNLTIDDLHKATAGGHSAIVGTDKSKKDAHALVLDGFDNDGNALIRDPAFGEAYGLSPDYFSSIWNGRAVYAVGENDVQKP